MLFYVAKVLEVLGLASVGLSIAHGVARGQSPDPTLFMVGLVVFYVGRALEGRSSKGG